jgi:hypothetical protein
MEGVSYKLGLFVFAKVAWALWKSRNKMAIEKRFPSHPLVIIRSGIVFVQKWRLLLKEADQEHVDKVLARMQNFLEGFTPSTAVVIDIFEIC